jgi:23S rRNA (cytosine1962-C5)-methyltransferase
VPLIQDVQAALATRAALLSALAEEGTDCVRLFHGVAEGSPGLTIDRYGPLVLVQDFREALDEPGWAALQGLLADAVPDAPHQVLNQRGKPKDTPQAPASEAALADHVGREAGLNYRVRARHRGQDPLLFLDLRAGRRWVREQARGLSVLNAFAYTCGVGLAAAAGGARQVWNVDFAASSLDVGDENAALNGLSMTRVQDDALLVLRQLAGLPIKGRAARKKYTKRAPRTFDLVVLDPPRWARSRFGAVDVARDYPSLFKPAVLAAKPGGRVLATNHLAGVPRDEWVGVLERCARKAGRPLQSVELLEVEPDFPTFDGQAPLKLAVCQI